MQPAAWADNDRIRTEGSTAIVTAALAAGVGRLIQESVSMLYRDRGDEWIDEAWPTDDYPMAWGDHAAEANAKRFTAAGGVGVVLRFGWFYGPGATHTEEFFALARRRICIMRSFVAEHDGQVVTTLPIRGRVGERLENVWNARGVTIREHLLL